jgi:hypothetical protein
MMWVVPTRVASFLGVALLLVGCTPPASRDIGIGSSDVASIEVYLYAYAPQPRSVTRSLMTDRREIDDLVKAFADMPVKALAHSSSDLVGRKTAGLRFVLRDGGALELTQVFIEPNDVVVSWPDGAVVSTTWGAAVGDSGTPSDPAANTPAEASQWPKVSIP